MTVDSSRSITEVKQRLDDLLNFVHPLMVEAFYFAAIPHWYNETLLGHQRQRSDGREPGLMTRLDEYTFIEQTSYDGKSEATFVVQATERRIFNEHCIRVAPNTYRAAHARCLEYWYENENPNPYAQAQQELYHQYFVDLPQAENRLITLYREYLVERQLAAIEQLLNTTDEAFYYLEMLDKNDKVGELKLLVTYMRARLAQLTNDIPTSLRLLDTIQKQPNSPLLPYAIRVRGLIATTQGRFGDAIDHLEEAIAAFDRVPPVERQNPNSQAIDRAETLVELGNAHLGLAERTRGFQDGTRPAKSIGDWVHNFSQLVLALPLVAYLSRVLGADVWKSRMWPVYRYLDWIVARLFTMSANEYEKADKVLDSAESESVRQLADEQLGFLYLKLGDVTQARDRFETLVESAELSDYRRANVRLGLGQAYLYLGDHERAKRELEQALPVLKSYGDSKQEAAAAGLLGEAVMDSAEPEQTIHHFNRALRLHRQTNDLEGATQVSEQLRAFSADKRLTQQERQNVLAVAARQKMRHYRVRFRHLTTVTAQRASLLLLIGLLFFIPVLTIRLQNAVTGSPDITFQTPSLLDPNTTPASFSAGLAQAVTILDIGTEFEPDVLILGAIGVVLAYLALTTALGAYAIRRASPRRLEKIDQNQIVRVSEEGVSIGSGESRRAIKFANVTEMVIGNTTIIKQLRRDDSNAALYTPTERIVINGNTAHYEALIAQIAEKISPSATKRDISYKMFRSLSGLILGLSLLLIVLLTVISGFAPTFMVTPIGLLLGGGFQSSSLFGLSIFSIADLTPFLYLGLFLPIIRWFVVKPIHLRSHIKGDGEWPFICSILALLLLIGIIATSFQAWWTAPDIYPALTAIVMTCVATWAFWNRTRHPRFKQLSHDATWFDKVATRMPLALASTVLSVVIIAISGAHLVRELRVYGLQVQANNLVGIYQERIAGFSDDRDLTNEELAQFESALAGFNPLEVGLESYTNAIEIAETPILGLINKATTASLYANLAKTEMANGTSVNTSESTEMLLSPAPAINPRGGDAAAETVIDSEVEQVIEVSRLGLTTERSDYERAIEHMDRAIELNDRFADYYLWAAFAAHSIGNVDEALAKYNAALDVGGTKRLRGDSQAKAHLGIGWVKFEQEAFGEAIAAFEKATEVGNVSDATLSASLQGQGYAAYFSQDYSLALDSWTESAELEPNNAKIYDAIGTGHYRLATPDNSNLCIAGTTDTVKLEAQQHFFDSIDNFERAATLVQAPADQALSYRTAAQVGFLLSKCPDVEQVVELEKAANRYQNAIDVDPDNAFYYHMRGRLLYAAWTVSTGSGPGERERLFDGLQSADDSIQLAPDNDSYADWRDIIAKEAIDGSIRRGDQLFTNGQLTDALDYYILVAENAPLDPTSALRAGITEIVLGNESNGEAWLAEGIDRAEATGDQIAIQTTLNNLRNLTLTYPTQVESVLEYFGEESNISPDTLIDDAGAALSEAGVLIEQNQVDAALERFETGVGWVRSPADLRALESALIPVLQNDSIYKNEILTTVEADFGRIESEADDGTIAAAADLGVIAAGIGSIDRAAYWFDQAIRRVNSGAEFAELRAIRNRLFALWETTSVEAAPLVVQMESIKPTPTARGLQADGFYWRYRAWFFYHIGLSAFRLDATDQARTALNVAEESADIAFEISDVHSFAHFYIREGAWGWYYVVRGNEAFDAGDIDAAYDAYSTAAAVYEPEFDTTAQGESAQAAFLAGKTALLRDDLESAEAWYDIGLANALEYSTTDQLDRAIVELQELAVTGEAERVRQTILQKLGAER